MLLDTSINMAMQPFKMLVGDMVNEKQKGLAYSIQSFYATQDLLWATYSLYALDGLESATQLPPA